MYSWSRYTPLDQVKVVILGQVRRLTICLWTLSHSCRTHIIMMGKLTVCHGAFFPGPPLTLPSVGLSFSVRPGVKLPGSLRNIYKQIATDYPAFVAPKSGYVFLIPILRIPHLRAETYRLLLNLEFYGSTLACLFELTRPPRIRIRGGRSSLSRYYVRCLPGSLLKGQRRSRGSCSWPGVCLLRRHVQRLELMRCVFRSTLIDTS